MKTIKSIGNVYWALSDDENLKDVVRNVITFVLQNMMKLIKI